MAAPPRQRTVPTTGDTLAAAIDTQLETLLAALEEPEEMAPVEPAEHHWEPHCGPGGWSCVGETVGGVVGAVVRSLLQQKVVSR